MWIDSVSPSEAVGELKDMYERIGGARGVAQIHQAGRRPNGDCRIRELRRCFDVSGRGLGECMRLLYTDPPGC